MQNSGKKPRHPQDFVSLAERRIRDAMNKGEFENLPGQGQPLEFVDALIPQPLP